MRSGRASATHSHIGSQCSSRTTDTIVSVHTGGYRLGKGGVLCGRITSLNHRIDLPDVLAWIIAND
jgi:hypothetical protein